MEPSIVVYASRLPHRRVLVMLHGLGHSILPFSHYLANTPEIDDGTTTVCVTYGVTFTSFSHLAEQLWTMLRSFGFTSNLVLFGYSMGGFLAQEFARKYTSAVVGLILMSTGCATYGTLPLTIKGRFMELVTSFQLLEVVDNGKSIFPSSWFLTSDENFLMARGNLRLGRKGNMAKMERNAQMHAILMYMNASQYRSLPDAIAPIQDIPTLILHGSKDSVLSLSGACAMHKVFKRSNLYIFKNAGHGVLFQHSAQVCKIINAWLTKAAPPISNAIPEERQAQPRSGSGPGPKWTNSPTNYSFVWVPGSERKQKKDG